MSERHCSSPRTKLPLRPFKTSSELRTSLIPSVYPASYTRPYSSLVSRALEPALIPYLPLASGGFFPPTWKTRNAHRDSSHRSQASPSTIFVFVFPVSVLVFLNDRMQIGTIDPAG
jgi:hypothetical protein